MRKDIRKIVYEMAIKKGTERVPLWNAVIRVSKGLDRQLFERHFERNNIAQNWKEEDYSQIFVMIDSFK